MASSLMHQDTSDFFHDKPFSNAALPPKSANPFAFESHPSGSSEEIQVRQQLKDICTKDAVVFGTFGTHEDFLTQEDVNDLESEIESKREYTNSKESRRNEYKKTHACQAMAFLMILIGFFIAAASTRCFNICMLCENPAVRSSASGTSFYNKDGQLVEFDKNGRLVDYNGNEHTVSMRGDVVRVSSNSQNSGGVSNNSQNNRSCCHYDSCCDYLSDPLTYVYYLTTYIFSNFVFALGNTCWLCCLNEYVLYENGQVVGVSCGGCCRAFWLFFAEGFLTANRLCGCLDCPCCTCSRGELCVVNTCWCCCDAGECCDCGVENEPIEFEDGYVPTAGEAAALSIYYHQNGVSEKGENKKCIKTHTPVPIKCGPKQNTNSNSKNDECLPVFDPPADNMWYEIKLGQRCAEGLQFKTHPKTGKNLGRKFDIGRRDSNWVPRGVDRDGDARHSVSAKKYEEMKRMLAFAKKEAAREKGEKQRERGVTNGNSALPSAVFPTDSVRMRAVGKKQPPSLAELARTWEEEDQESLSEDLYDDSQSGSQSQPGSQTYSQESFDSDSGDGTSDGSEEDGTIDSDSSNPTSRKIGTPVTSFQPTYRPAPAPTASGLTTLHAVKPQQSRAFTEYQRQIDEMGTRVGTDKPPSPEIATRALGTKPLGQEHVSAMQYSMRNPQSAVQQPAVQQPPQKLLDTPGLRSRRLGSRAATPTDKVSDALASVTDASTKGKFVEVDYV